MKTYNIGTKLVLSVAMFGIGGVFASGTAQAGRNGSPALIKSAIASNSVDAIEAELERSEYLVCAACSDLVVPLVDHLDYRVRKVAAWWIADSDEQVRAEAALTLGSVLRTGKTGAQPAGVNELVSALAHDPSADVRKKAAWSLGEMGAPAAAAGTVLQTAATSDPNP